MTAEGKILGGRYRLLDMLGQGAMSIVWRAEDQQLSRAVAVKLMLPHLASSEEARQRFQREARAVARLDHPHIVAIHDFSSDVADETFLVMEEIKGRTLAAVAEAVTFTVPELGMLFALPVARALAHAHQHGVVHRDLKPENIMVSNSGQVKLMDFGIARVADANTLTTTGAILGSPAYMAPEYIEGLPADERADIFSMGAILYRLATGRLPFDAPSPVALFKRIALGRYDDPRMVNPCVSDRLAACIATAMAVEPKDRYASADELVIELEGLLADIKVEDSDYQRALLLAEPNAYQDTAAMRLADDCLARAQQAAATGAVGLALHEYDRVLAYRPDDPTAVDGVHRLHRLQSRRQRRRLAFRFALMVGLVGSLGAAGVEYWPLLAAGPPAPRPVSEGTSLTTTPAGGSSQTMASVTGTDGATPSRPTPGKRPGRVNGRRPGRLPVAPPPDTEAMTDGSESPPAAANRTPVDVRIHARPWANIWVDDVLVARNAMQPVPLSLTPGSHTARFEHPASQPLTQKIDVPSNPATTPEYRFHLQPRPVRLVLDVADGAVVEVGGHRYVTSQLSRSEGILVELPEKQFRFVYPVRVLEKGKQPWTREVLFKAGDTVRLDVKP